MSSILAFAISTAISYFFYIGLIYDKGSLPGLSQASLKFQISVHSHSYRDYIEYLKLIHEISFFGFAIRNMICAFFVHMQTR